MSADIFVMARPSLTKDWLGIFRPLSSHMWGGVALSLLLVAATLMMFMRKSRDPGSREGSRGFWVAVQDLTGLLVGQDARHLMAGTSSSKRLLVATWLIFSYVVVSVYNGNLTASLTVSKAPPLVETLPQVVAGTDRLTMKNYISGLRQSLLKSLMNRTEIVDPPKMVIVTSTADALREVLTKREAHLDGREYLQYIIAEKFTAAEGSTRLYLVRERLLMHNMAWLLPHDAPYTARLDHWLRVVRESGMYEKWTRDVVSHARTGSQARRPRGRQTQARGAPEPRADAPPGLPVPLALTHLQGAFAVLLSGTALALLSFWREVFCDHGRHR